MPLSQSCLFLPSAFYRHFQICYDDDDGIPHDENHNDLNDNSDHDGIDHDKDDDGDNDDIRLTTSKNVGTCIWCTRRVPSKDSVFMSKCPEGQKRG